MLSRSTNKVFFKLRCLSVKRICCFHFWVKSYHHTYQCQNCSISCLLSSNRRLTHKSTRLTYFSAAGKKWNLKERILFNLKTSWNYWYNFTQTLWRVNNHSRHWVGVYLAFQNMYLDDVKCCQIKSLTKDWWLLSQQVWSRTKTTWFSRSTQMTTRHISFTLPKSYTATTLQLGRCCSQLELVTYSTNTKITSIIQEMLVLV